MHKSNHLTVLSFPNATQAFELRDALVKLEDESLLEMIDAVVVTRDAAGGVKVHQSVSGTPVFAAAGSVAGMIAGALVMSPWFGSAVGGVAGGVIGRFVDLGINDEFIKSLGDTITPGASALFLLGSKLQIDKVGEKHGTLFRGATLLHTTVTKDREEEIRKLLQGT